MFADMFNPTPAENLFLLFATIMGCIMWWYIIKGLIALWRKTPDQIKDAAKARGMAFILTKLIKK